MKVKIYFSDVFNVNTALPQKKLDNLTKNVKFSVNFNIREANAEKNANDLVNKIEEKFSKLMSKSESLGTVILSSCKAYSESKFTLEDLRNTVEYRFDYLSYRTNPEGSTLD